jgi:hypothetical protein
MFCGFCAFYNRPPHNAKCAVAALGYKTIFAMRLEFIFALICIFILSPSGRLIRKDWAFPELQKPPRDKFRFPNKTAPRSNPFATASREQNKPKE